MINTEVKCDSCNAKLDTPTQYEADYYLELSQDSAPRAGGATFAMYVHPLLDRRKHFCGFKCLENWAKKQTTPQESVTGNPGNVYCVACCGWHKKNGCIKFSPQESA